MAAPVYDNSVVSSIMIGTNPTTTGSVGITVGGGANNYTFIDIIATNGGSQHWVPGSATFTITCGGVTFASLGSVLIGNVDVAGFIWRFGAANVPSGAQTANVSLTEVGQQFGQAWILVSTYTGVGSVGALQTSFGVSASPALSVPSATGNLVSAVIADYASGLLTSFSLTQRQYVTSNVPIFIAGDGAGSASVSVTASNSAGAHWAVLGNDMQPVGAPAVPTNAFFSMF